MPFRSLSGQARAELLWLLASLALLNLPLALAIEFRLPELRDPSYGYRLRCLMQRKDTAHQHAPMVIMLGSSRTAFGFRAARTQEILARQTGQPVAVFNLGIYGAGPLTELLTFQRLRVAGIRPDLLLIELTPAFLAGQAGAPQEIERIPATRLALRELPLLRSYGLNGRTLYRDWWRAWPIPWYAHRYQFLSLLAPAWLPFQLREDTWQHVDDCGSPAPYGNAEILVRGQARAVETVLRQYRPYFCGFRLSESACRALHDLVSRCRQEGTGVALILMPEGTAFRGLYSSEAWAQVEGMVDNLRRDAGAAVIDAREWITDDGFSDSHHLLPDAAEVFSRRLAQEIARLLGRNDPADSRLAGR
jgi:hypothetical protein